MYNTYFFFALTCRLPILCMALSTVSLMAFLLAVAWTAWPTAVLVMSFVAGFLLTSQFVIFGLHRLINLVVWTVRVAWRAVVRGRSAPCPEAQLRPQGADEQGEPRIEMPVPRPCPSPAPVVAASGYLTADPKAQCEVAQCEVAQWTEEVRVSVLPSRVVCGRAMLIRVWAVRDGAGWPDAGVTCLLSRNFGGAMQMHHLLSAVLCWRRSSVRPQRIARMWMPPFDKGIDGSFPSGRHRTAFVSLRRDIRLAYSNRSEYGVVHVAVVSKVLYDVLQRTI